MTGILSPQVYQQQSIFGRPSFRISKVLEGVEGPYVSSFHNTKVRMALEIDHMGIHLQR